MCKCRAVGNTEKNVRFSIWGRIVSETWTKRSENWTEYFHPKAQKAQRKAAKNLRASLRFLYAVACLLFAAAVARAGGFGFSILFAQHCLSGKLDLVAFAADALHENLLTFFQLVAHVLHATIRNL